MSIKRKDTASVKRTPEKHSEKKFKKTYEKRLTTPFLSAIIQNVPRNMREWRNRQTRTFEGRVVIPYGFKSRLSHQNRQAFNKACRFFFLPLHSSLFIIRRIISYYKTIFHHKINSRGLILTSSPDSVCLFV